MVQSPAETPASALRAPSVMNSGLLGLAMQKWIPHVLASGLRVEVLYDRIPELVRDLKQRSDALAATCEESVQTLYARRVAPELEAPTRKWIYCFDITGGIQFRRREFDYLGGLLNEQERDKLQQLQRLFEAKLEMDAHFTLQWALRSWLYLHVPTSLLLLALVAAHVGTVLYY